MAIQAGNLMITGSFGNLNYYVAKGKYIVRRKPRVRTDILKKGENYELSRLMSDMFGKGSTIAKEVYRKLPEEKRVWGFFGTLVPIAAKALKYGKSKEEVIKLLEEYLGID